MITVFFLSFYPFVKVIGDEYEKENFKENGGRIVLLDFLFKTTKILFKAIKFLHNTMLLSFFRQ